VVPFSPIGISRRRLHVREQAARQRARYEVNWGLIAGLAGCACVWGGLAMLLLRHR
jgi:hypothetical protein